MSFLQSILLGIIQGLTEFLPVSSSAHLVVLPRLLGWRISPDVAFVFDVLVQVATLLAVISYFWKDLIAIAREFFLGIFHRKPFTAPEARLGWLIILASIPAGVFGLLIKNWIEQAFTSLIAVGIFLFCTALLLMTAERMGHREKTLDEITWQDALWIGAFQAAAVFPGISRSGATITGGMLRQVERPAAARFSFLMAIPIMLAAGGLETVKMLQTPRLLSQLPPFIPGFIAAAVVGYLSIRWLLKYLMQHSLYDFAIYCVAAGMLAILLGAVGG